MFLAKFDPGQCLKELIFFNASPSKILKKTSTIFPTEKDFFVSCANFHASRKDLRFLEIQ